MHCGVVSQKGPLLPTLAPFVSSSQGHLRGWIQHFREKFLKIFSFAENCLLSIPGSLPYTGGYMFLNCYLYFFLLKYLLLQKEGEGRRKSAPSSLWDRTSLQALAFLSPTQCNLTLNGSSHLLGPAHSQYSKSQETEIRRNRNS